MRERDSERHTDTHAEIERERETDTQIYQERKIEMIENDR